MSYRSVIAADTPLHWWRLSVPGGALALDNGSNPVHLFNPNNTALFAYSGIASDGGSGFFPGNSNVIDLDNLPNLVSPLSVEAWMWQFSLNPTPAVQALVGWNGITAGVQLAVDATGHPSWTAQVATVAPTVALIQAWHHVVGTKSGVLEALYVDGALSNSIGNAVAINITQPLSIGAVTTATRFFRGWIAEVAIYGYALTGAQVAAHYAAREVSIPPTFFGTGKLDVTTGAVATEGQDLTAILAAIRRTYQNAP